MNRIELETMILSSLLKKPELLFCSNLINEETFGQNDYKEIFKIMESLSADKKKFDFSYVIDYFSSSCYKDKITDLYKIDSIENESVFIKLLQQVKDIQINEELKLILNKYQNRVKKDSLGLDNLTGLISELNKIELPNPSVEENFDKVVSDFLQSYENENSYYTFKSLPKFSELIAGIGAGELISMIGFTGAGKTTLAVQMFLDLIVQNIPCGYISLEMKNKEIFTKILSMYKNISTGEIRKKTIDKNYLNKVAEETRQDLRTKLVKFWDLSINENELKKIVSKWVDEIGLKVLFIDNFNLINTISKSKESRERELAFISRVCKTIATDNNISIIMLSQSNREGEEIPSMKNIGECFALSRDSTAVFLYYSPLKTLKNGFSIENLNDGHRVIDFVKTRFNENIQTKFLLKYANNVMEEVDLLKESIKEATKKTFKKHTKEPQPSYYEPEPENDVIKEVFGIN